MLNGVSIFISDIITAIYAQKTKPALVKGFFYFLKKWEFVALKNTVISPLANQYKRKKQNP